MAPIAIFVYKRPLELSWLLHALGKEALGTVHVFGDGPKSKKDKEGVASARKIIEEWAVPTICHWRTEHAGCHRNITEGVSNVLSLHERVIVLEEDCYPSPDFLRYAETMLEYYARHPHVMHISGANTLLVQPTWLRPKMPEGSYSLTPWVNSHGWATWRHAWKKFRGNFSVQEAGDLFGGKIGLEHASVGEKMSRGKNLAGDPHWDFEWLCSILAADGLSCIPNCNMVSHMGRASSSQKPLGRLRNLILPATDQTELPWEGLGEIVHPKTASLYVAKKSADWQGRSMGRLCRQVVSQFGYHQPSP